MTKKSKSSKKHLLPNGVMFNAYPDSIGRNLYIPTNASGDAIEGTAGQDGLGTLAQGFIEMSNVSVVDEMVKMISAQRAYEINSKTIQAADEMLQQANTVKR